MPPASDPTWQLFLEVERCAVPLAERLQGMREPSPEPLRTVAVLEMQSALGALREMRRLDAIASGRGLRALVLKGGAAIAEGRLLGVADIDLLVEADAALEWEGALREQGRVAVEGSVPLAGLRHHHPMGTHMEAGGLMVELHTAVPHAGLDGDPFSRSLPLEGFRALRRMSPPDQAWHVLVHSAVHHPERRGRIRDLVLLASSLAGLTDRQAAELRRRAASHPARAVAGVLAMAEGLLAGRVPEDPYRELAALGYLLRAEAERLPADPRAAHVLAEAAAYACAAERAAYLARPTGRGATAPLVWGVRALRLLRGLPWARRARQAVESE